MAEEQEINQILRNQYRKQFLLAIEERRIEDAITYFTRIQDLVLEKTEIEDNIYNLAGLCYYQLGKWKVARSCFLASYEINECDENRANQYLKELTEEEVNRLEQIEKQVLEMMSAREYKKAKKLLKANRKLGVTIQNSLLLGLCEYGRKRKMNALVYFKEALEIDSSNKTALRLMRSLKIREGVFENLLCKTIMRY